MNVFSERKEVIEMGFFVSLSGRDGKSREKEGLVVWEWKKDFGERDGRTMEEVAMAVAEKMLPIGFEEGSF